MNNKDFDYSHQYENWHKDTQESKARDMAWGKAIFDTHGIYPKRADDKVLEIGCGMGRYLLMLKSVGFSNLTGVEIDRALYRIAKKENLNVHLSDALSFFPIFRKKSKRRYRVIYAFDVLEHIAKHKQLSLLKKMYKHLADDGFIVIQVPNALSPTALYFRYTDFTHVVSYTKETLEFLLHNAGFHFAKVRPQHQETAEIQQLKLPWARLYRQEYCLTNPDDYILTPNIIVIACKNQQVLEEYLSQAPHILNDYPEVKAKKNTPA